MNNLKLFGTVREVFPQRTGTSQTTGSQWWSQDFTLDIADGKFTQTVKFSLSGRALNKENIAQLTAGNSVTVSFSLVSREATARDGRIFYNTNANAWKIEAGDTTASTQEARANVSDFQPTFAPTTQPTAQPTAQQPAQQPLPLYEEPPF